MGLPQTPATSKSYKNDKTDIQENKQPHLHCPGYVGRKKIEKRRKTIMPDVDTWGKMHAYSVGAI
jgi:hypothetical protein